LGADIGYTLTQTNDNGYLITGVLDVTASGGQGNSKTSKTLHAGGDYWAIKLDANGTQEWSKFFGGSFTDTPYGVVETNDNSFIIVGASDSDDIDIKNNKGAYDFWVVKIAATGDLIWEKSFGGSKIDEAWGITTTNDNNFIIAGDTRSTDKDVITNNGQTTVGGANVDIAFDVIQLNDASTIAVGASSSADQDITENKGFTDMLIFKIK